MYGKSNICFSNKVWRFVYLVGTMGISTQGHGLAWLWLIWQLYHIAFSVCSVLIYCNFLNERSNLISVLFISLCFVVCLCVRMWGASSSILQPYRLVSHRWTGHAFLLLLCWYWWCCCCCCCCYWCSGDGWEKKAYRRRRVTYAIRLK